MPDLTDDELMELICLYRLCAADKDTPKERERFEELMQRYEQQAREKGETK